MTQHGGEVLAGFYVLEGVDGAGTTTQADKLADHFAHRGKVWRTCEPSDAAVGSLIRRALHDNPPLSDRTLALLYAADRQEHVFGTNGIRERCLRGEPVVCDRYLFSSLAYQGSALSFDLVHELNAHFPLPEVLIFLDTPLAIAAQRMQNREALDHLEQPGVQERVIQAYHQVLGRSWPDAMRVVRIDGTQPPDAVFAAILGALAQ